MEEIINPNKDFPIIYHNGGIDLLPIFGLEKQPKSRQRKSYYKEIRYIQPKMKVQCRKNVGIINGTVNVKLVKQDGSSDVKGILNDAKINNNNITKEFNFSTFIHFDLYVTECNEGEYALLFTITYDVLESNIIHRYIEIILSSPFQIHTGIDRSFPTPLVIDIMPKSGPSNIINEIWIKGKRFNENTIIIINNNIRLECLEKQDNLLIVRIPILENENINSVELKIINILGSKYKIADRKPIFYFN